MKVTFSKTAQITFTFLRNSKSASDQIYLKACVTHSFSVKFGGEEGLCLATLVLYHRWVGLNRLTLASSFRLLHRKRSQRIGSSLLHPGGLTFLNFEIYFHGTKRLRGYSACKTQFRI